MKGARGDVAVVGGGPAGLASAIALAQSGVPTTLIAPEPTEAQRTDARTAALFDGSIRLLGNLGVWDAVSAASAPISAIRIVDDTGTVLRAPETLFPATDAGLDVFGYNVPNGPLVAALWARATATAGLEIRPETLKSLVIAGPAVDLTTARGATIPAALVVAADGRNSICRAAAAISTRRWDYEQAALATRFAHTRPHRGISTELHRAAGPLTTVPLPGLASSLVWVERPAEAARLAALTEDEFRAVLEERLQGLLGTLGAFGRRTVFPLSGLTPDRFGQRRVALVGESGHVIPPIGAQGLNLGLRDAATIAELAANASAAGRDPGGADVLDAYTAARSTDVTSRIWAVDLMNRSLLADVLPVRLARGAGLYALKSFDSLRRRVVQEGVAPSGHVPALMRAGSGRASLV